MNKKDKCPLCAGLLDTGKTTFTVDFGKGVVVVRYVPALVCSQCGEAWIEDEQSKRLEKIVKEAKLHSREFEVVNLAA